MYSAIVRLSDGARTLSCPATWLTSWGLEPGQTVRLAFGQRTTSVTLKANDLNVRAVVSLPPSAQRHLLAPTGVRLGLARQEDGLRLGPVVGILSSLHLRGGAPAPARLGPQAAFFAQVCDAGRQRGAVIYVFGPEHIRWASGSVAAVVRRGRAWGRAILPLPDIVYVRTQTRSSDRRPDVARCLQRLEKTPGITVLNSRFFDKWELHQALSGNEAARRYLPVTRRYASSRDVSELLASYPRVFLKPAGGSLGKGIIRITRIPGVGYEYRVSLGTGDRRTVLPSLKAVLRRARAAVGRRRYIVQQGLHLARLRGSTFDVRLLMQKDARGQWAVSSRVARLAAPDRLATNVALGGRAVGSTRVIRAALGSLTPSSQQLNEAGRVLATALEEGLGHELAEVGIDLGIDRHGRIWVIEANSRPARYWPWPPPRPIQRSVRGVLAFFLFRTGFLSSEKETRHGEAHRLHRHHGHRPARRSGSEVRRTGAVLREADASG
ncbi:MAG: YheC/YheD family protein [Bacillota bacterium]